jgi:oligopeptidase A
LDRLPDNPLLDFADLPPYAELRPAHVAPAVDLLLAEARAAVTRAEQAPAEWDAFVEPLEDATERLARAWGQVSHLHAVLDSPELRAAYNESLPKLTQFWTELGHNERLFERYRALAASPGFATLPAARQRIVENALRDFRLGGAELAPDAKRRYGAIQEELARLGTKFSENLLDATNGWSVEIEDEARLAGIPQDVLDVARQGEARRWKFTLHMPSYLPVLQYAQDRALREQMYRAYATRASEFGSAALDNTPIMARILPLRREAARLLGYPSYAELSLVPKMADTPAQVIGFLEDLAQRARQHAERDLDELRAYARDALELPQLEAWDLPFASERLRQQRYAFSNQDVKRYFPEDAVIGGLFRLVETLYGLRIAPASASMWHGDARFYEVRDARGECIGQFYVDLYARETKRGGAWMDEVRSRRRLGESVQTPVAHLVCNFSRPAADRPALFTHDEVQTLFHEFGHALHHLLTRVDDLGVSGINGVEWDAVELPSQFMENFCWEWDVLRHMTRHADTGEPLPRALYDKMLAARNFQSGLAMLRQIEFAMFDMRLHHEDAADGARTPLELLREVRAKIAVIVPPEWNRFPNSFSHIFGGGYAAGYYSYKWAEVLSADAYAAFEEAPAILDARTGARFRDEILAVGGSRPAAESFRAFRGREPRVEALLRHNGMIPA